MGRPQTPPCTVDIVIEMIDRPGRPVVLIERRYPPPGWALPGGFIDPGETVAAAAIREAREETSLEVTLDALLGVYSAPDRDPRGQTIAMVFTAQAQGRPVAADDASNVRLIDPASPPAMAFDHERILADYVEFRRSGKCPLPD